MYLIFLFHKLLPLLVAAIVGRLTNNPKLFLELDRNSNHKNIHCFVHYTKLLTFDVSKLNTG